MIYKIILITLIAINVHANQLDMNTLQTRNLDEVQTLVQNQIQKSQEIALKSQQDGTEAEKESDVIFELKKA